MKEIAHSEIDTLLPWYANGSLDASANREVAQHLERCAECREELQFLGDVRAVLRIAAAAEQPAPARVHSGFASLPAELQARVASAQRKPMQRKRYWVPALAASLLAAIGLGVALAVAYLDAPRFQTATSGNPASSVHGSAVVAIRFVPDTALEEMNTLLQQYDAVIVRGPDQRGTWLLELPLHELDVAQLRLLLESNAGVQSVEVTEDPAGAE